MNNAAVSHDELTVLSRHQVRRNTGVSTATVLVGIPGIARRTWTRWATTFGSPVVFAEKYDFPLREFIRRICNACDVPGEIVKLLAKRSHRDPEDFVKEWRIKSKADRETFWKSLSPERDDDLDQLFSKEAEHQNWRELALKPKTVERIAPWFASRFPDLSLPSVFFTANTIEEFEACATTIATWIQRVPSMPVAIATPDDVWSRYLSHSSESRIKAILREGLVATSALDQSTIGDAFKQSGGEHCAAAKIVADLGADATLLDSAVNAVRTCARPPETRSDDDQAPPRT